MPKTRMAYDRIKNMHDAGNHERCQFGCSPENQAPSQTAEFDAGRIAASRELAAKLGRNDPRVALAIDVREFFDTRPDLPEMVMINLGGCAALDEDLSGPEPDLLDLLKVRRGRRILDDARAGVYHNLNTGSLRIGEVPPFAPIAALISGPAPPAFRVIGYRHFRAARRAPGDSFLRARQRRGFLGPRHRRPAIKGCFTP